MHCEQPWPSIFLQVKKEGPYKCRCKVGHAEESNEAKLSTFLRWLVITIENLMWGQVLGFWFSSKALVCCLQLQSWGSWVCSGRHWGQSTAGRRAGCLPRKLQQVLIPIHLALMSDGWPVTCVENLPAGVLTVFREASKICSHVMVLD